MTSQRDAATARRVRGQGHILEALADDAVVLTGTLDRLGQRFGLPLEVVRICLLELLDAGWVRIDVRPSGSLTALRPRTAGALTALSVRVERRRSADRARKSDCESGDHPTADEIVRHDPVDAPSPRRIRPLNPRVPAAANAEALGARRH